jgi:hypothetical protein
MKIVFLGWGSLIWNPDGLPLAGDWQQGGPLLPMEFSRISSDGRLTLVIDEINGTEVVTRYALSSRTDLQHAVEDLRKREGTVQASIGFVDLVEGAIKPNQSTITSRIWDWANTAGVDAVVWTSLTSNFNQRTADRFSVRGAVAYLKGLQGTDLERALEYIRKAPEEVNTPLRRALHECGLIFSENSASN